MRLVRRLLGLVTLAAVAVGAAVVLRRRAASPNERVDLYYRDGSMTSFEESSPDAARLFAFAREALATARAG